MFCRYCGERLPDDALFCSACGKRVTEEKQKAGSVERPRVHSDAPEWLVSAIADELEGE
jgi:hypothetical protein